jgi:hypothetical protein
MPLDTHSGIMPFHTLQSLGLVRPLVLKLAIWHHKLGYQFRTYENEQRWVNRMVRKGVVFA